MKRRQPARLLPKLTGAGRQAGPQFISEYSREHGCSPSTPEIAEAAGLASPSSVAYPLRVLGAVGIVSYDSAFPRTVKVLRHGLLATWPAGGNGEAPGGAEPESPGLLGRAAGKGDLDADRERIAAGGPITAEQSIEDYLPLPREVVGGGERLFILQVVGDSMIGCWDLPGDRLVISPCSSRRKRRHRGRDDRRGGAGGQGPGSAGIPPCKSVK